MKSTERRSPARSTDSRLANWEPAIAYWIENDGLLRDEGIVFGMSGIPTVPESKIEAIAAYYRARIARTEAKRRAVQEERDRLNRRVEVLAKRIDFLSQDLWEPLAPRNDSIRADDVQKPHGEQTAPDPESLYVDQPSYLYPAPMRDSARPADAGSLLRYGLGSICAAAICIMAYFIVREVLGDEVRYPEWISIGVILSGMFTVFAPTSLLFSSDRRHREEPWETELWKVRLAEIGFPIVAAAFVVVWGDRRDILRDLVAFSFLGLLFLFGGRLLLSLLTRSSHEFEYARLRWRRRRAGKLRRREQKRLEKQMTAVNQQIAALRMEIRHFPSEDELKAESDHKIALFRSEFELARAAIERGLPGDLDIDVVDG